MKPASQYSNCVWHPDMVDPLRSMFPPGPPVVHESNPRPGSGTALRRSGLPFPFPPSISEDLTSLFDYPPLVDEGPDELQGPNVDLHVQCEDTKMVISISKESLKVRGQHPSHSLCSGPVIWPWSPPCAMRWVKSCVGLVGPAMYPVLFLLHLYDSMV